MNGDLDGRLIGEDREGFCVGGSKRSSDSSEAQILNYLKFVDQELLWVVWIEPQLRSIGDDRNDACLV